MLPTNPLAAVLTRLALNDRPLITATPDKGTSTAPLQLQIGQQVQGTVQAQVAANQFQVRIADQLVQMQLPNFVRSGDIVTLQVVSLQPRLTFSLAASSNPVSTPESLSSAARLLSSLSQQPLEQSYVRPIQSAPLWTGGQALPDTSQLAGKLHDALSHSGLFYESHQAQWIAGTRPTTQLLMEPQNQLAQQQRLSARAAETHAAANLSGTAAATANSAGTAAHIPDHLQTLVQQQLNALETRQVLWQGQVWQGQEMKWEVKEDQSQRGGGKEAEGQWTTQIHLDLPRLGGVSARLSLNGGLVNMTFEINDPKSRERMSIAIPQLIAALADRGISVTQTQFTSGET